MDNKNRMILVAGVLTLVMLLPWTANAAPLQQGENLLQNPGFEGAYSPWSGIPQIQMPAGWVPWWADNSGDDPDWANHRPEWKPAEAQYYPTRVHSGERALQWFKSYATFWAGAYQQVNVPENAQLRFSAYGFGWSCADWEMCRDASSYEPANMRMRIGIDPTGGTSPWSASIVWSPTASPVWAWEYFQVEATAQGGTITVFLYANPDWPKQNQDSYYDDASLVVIGDAPPPAPTTAPENPAAPPPSQPAPAPVPVVTATPQADGSIIHTVQSGETAWSIAARYGISIDELNAWNNLGAFIQPGQQLLVRQATGEAPTEEPTPEPSGEAASETPVEEPAAEVVEESPAPEADAGEPAAEVAAAA